jgi:hypothetical protein
MQVIALPVAGESTVAILSEYPESASEDWANDEEALRSYAVSTCTNAWGLIYSQLFDGLRCEGGTSWQQPQRQ